MAGASYEDFFQGYTVPKNPVKYEFPAILHWRNPLWVPIMKKKIKCLICPTLTFSALTTRLWEDSYFAKIKVFPLFTFFSNKQFKNCQSYKCDFLSFQLQQDIYTASRQSDNIYLLYWKCHLHLDDLRFLAYTLYWQLQSKEICTFNSECFVAP